MAQQSKRANDVVYEAIVNGDESGSYDPVECIVVKLENGYSYRLEPKEVQSLIIRERQS
jgi:hypothetical protein